MECGRATVEELVSMVGNHDSAGTTDSRSMVNVLWVTNVALPEASSLMGKEPSAFGGWLVNASSALAMTEGINLSVAFPDQHSTDTRSFRGKLIAYYQFRPLSAAEPRYASMTPRLAGILDVVEPDIVHIFGTEYDHALAMAELCIARGQKFVLSIQGLVSVCARHYVTGLPLRIQFRFTPRDLLRWDNVRLQARKFAERGKREIQTLGIANHVVGRTTWDKACVAQINPRTQYHKCNEILRDAFYHSSWSLEACERFSIFVSQGDYPIKGLHFLLEAMPIVLRRFPEARVYVAGYDVTGGSSLSHRMRRSSYGKYIRELIIRHHLGERVTFVGVLNEEEMCSQYVKSHVFVLPSTIENSPNSLGEAMLLGVPCIAADVGGVSDLAQAGVDSLIYQGDAAYMLAHYICEVFNDDRLAVELSHNAKRRASSTHDVEINTRNLVSIYRSICHEDSEDAM
jgi:glycosyltransferase involved in cell wall biosynthesis